MAVSPTSGDGDSKLDSCFIHSKTILDAQSLAVRFDLSLAHVFQSTVALLSSIYNYADAVTQAIFTIHESSQSSPPFDLCHVKSLKVQIDQHLPFLDFVKSVSALPLPNKDMVNAKGMCTSNAYIAETQEQHQAVDAIVCLHEISDNFHTGTLNRDFAPQAADLMRQFNVCEVT